VPSRPSSSPSCCRSHARQEEEENAPGLPAAQTLPQNPQEEEKELEFSELHSVFIVSP